MAIRKLLIANRGEIAVRIIRAARELGIAPSRCTAQADTDSLAVQLADEAVEIGPPQAAKSYLNIDAVLEAARTTGADAIHPGYGFLAENARLRRCGRGGRADLRRAHGETIRLMGDKVAAREVAARGRRADGARQRGPRSRILPRRAPLVERDRLSRHDQGGGGRRRARHPRRARRSRVRAPDAAGERRGQAAFGDGGLYIEKLIERARHIEVQVLGDGERRRPLLSSGNARCSGAGRRCGRRRRRRRCRRTSRERLCASAVALAKSVSYRGAGTLEYLYDERRREFYLPRDEHPHPGRASGDGMDHRASISLREMLRIAGGEKLRLQQADICMPRPCDRGAHQRRGSGHGFHARSRHGRASSGCPAARACASIRMLYHGYTVPPFYDSLLGKLIVWGEDRRSRARAPEARARRAEDRRRQNDEAAVHRRLRTTPDVRAASVHTRMAGRLARSSNASRLL